MPVVGRKIHVHISLVFIAGRIPPETTDAFRSAMIDDIGSICDSLRIIGDEHLLVCAVIRAKHSLDALQTADVATNRCLVRTGLFEEFDVTGRDLRGLAQEHAASALHCAH
jgi:hypothetical protein